MEADNPFSIYNQETDVCNSAECYLYIQVSVHFLIRPKAPSFSWHLSRKLQLVTDPALVTTFTFRHFMV